MNGMTRDASWRHPILATCVVMASVSSACGSTSLPAKPEVGYVHVTVVTTGGDLDPDGFTIAVDAEPPRTSVGNSASVTESFPVASGSHGVTLGSVAANCTLTGTSTRTVNVQDSRVTDVVFEVVCVPTGLAITTRTLGSDTPDAYRLTVNDQPAPSIASNGSQTIPRLAPGSYIVALLAPAHCTVTGGARITVNVPAKTMATVPFEISCAPAVRSPKIAYANDTTVSGRSERWIAAVNVDGTGSVLLRPGDAPAWSADRTRVVFTTVRCVDERDDPDHVCAGRLQLFDPETGNIAPLTGAVYGLHAAWARANDVVAFDVDALAPGDDRELDLFRISTGVVTTLAVAGPTSVEQPAWSPDGTRLVFVCRWGATTTDLCIVNRDGTGLVRLTNDPQADAHPTWSPGGTTIASTRYPVGRTDDASAEIVLTNVATSQVTTLTKGLDPAWSPDGSKLAFAGGDGLFVIGADGTNRRRLTTGAHRLPAWRP
jgi:hypothetical protein